MVSPGTHTPGEVDDGAHGRRGAVGPRHRRDVGQAGDCQVAGSGQSQRGPQVTAQLQVLRDEDVGHLHRAPGARCTRCWCARRGGGVCGAVADVGRRQARIQTCAIWLVRRPSLAFAGGSMRGRRVWPANATRCPPPQPRASFWAWKLGLRIQLLAQCLPVLTALRAACGPFLSSPTALSSCRTSMSASPRKNEYVSFAVAFLASAGRSARPRQHSSRAALSIAGLPGSRAARRIVFLLLLCSSALLAGHVLGRIGCARFPPARMMSRALRVALFPYLIPRGPGKVFAGKNRQQSLVVLAAEAGAAVGDLDVELARALHDGLALERRHVVRHLGRVLPAPIAQHRRRGVVRRGTP